MVSNNNILSLFELTSLIQRTLSDNFDKLYWVKAELVKLNKYPQSGHCYPDLVEKENNKIKAQIKGIIWRDDYYSIETKFRRITHTIISPGMQLLFQVQVSYSPLYGLSIVIFDIDPTYTLGALAYEKQVTIDKLTQDGVINRNKDLKMPPLLQRIAIISADSSKGYNDFMQTIQGYKDKYTIVTKLFTAILQGDAAIPSQIAAFEEIKHHYDSFDAVVLMRGGGGDIGMNCYDNYNLSYEIATFPIPVITGIGHSTDSTIADMVAAANMKTPTEAANFILSGFISFDDALNDLQNHIINKTNKLINNFYYQLTTLSNNITSLLKPSLTIYINQLSYTIQQISKLPHLLLLKHNNSIDNLVTNIGRIASVDISNQKLLLDNIETRTSLLNPENIMKRGYSITYCNNKVVKDISEINEGDTIESFLYDGKIESTVKKLIIK